MTLLESDLSHKLESTCLTNIDKWQLNFDLVFMTWDKWLERTLTFFLIKYLHFSRYWEVTFWKHDWVISVANVCKPGNLVQHGRPAEVNAWGSHHGGGKSKNNKIGIQGFCCWWWEYEQNSSMQGLQLKQWHKHQKIQLYPSQHNPQRNVYELARKLSLSLSHVSFCLESIMRYIEKTLFM